MNFMDYMNFAGFYDCLTKNVDYPSRAARLDVLIRRFKHTTQNTEGCILLDLACGSGSMSEEMAKLGYDVIGVDNSPAMLAKAMDKKYESGLPIQYLCQDMRELDMYGTIDVTICTLDSLNHLPSLSDVEQVFQKVSLFAHPGGVFLFDMNTLYKHHHILKDKTFLYDTDEVFCVWENRIPEGTNKVEMQLTFFEPDGDAYYRSDEFITENAYDVAEITDALKRAGLEVLGIYDADADLECPGVLNSPSETTERILFVAGKPVMEDNT